ncbi:MAG: HAD hydrolase-like protein [Phocaeicola sp.]|nr:HAD hydrolase-like protein [Phocaeicola sp.]
MEITKATVFFFDMDGTLINTNTANFLSYKEAVSFVMGKETPFVSYNPMERFNRSLLRSLFLSFTESDYEKIIQEKERCYKDYISQTTIIKENVEILLKYSTTHKTVLVSNCRQDRGLDTLSYHGLTDKFTNLFYRDTTIITQRINKYQKAINLLEISPDNVVAFENEQTEIADAVEAGIKIINPQILL